MLLIFIILILLSICIILYGINWFRGIIIFRNKVNKFPGRKANFFIGDIFYLSRDREILFKEVCEFVKSFKNGYRLWGGFFAAYCFYKAEDYEVILSSPKYLDKTYIYTLLHPWLREGLLTSSEEKWHKRRKILTPAFHFNVLRKFVKIFGEHTDNFIDELKLECIKEKTDISPIVTKLTLGLICETAMGVKLQENNEKQEEYRKAVHELGALIIERIIEPLYFYDIIYKIFPSGRKFFRNVKILQNFTDEVIKERERNFKNEDVENLDEYEEDYAGFTKKRFAMLDLLISAKRNSGEIDDAGIREEVDTFMFEGHDTTSAAITFTIFCLANNKNVQDKARKEMDDIFGESIRPATYKDLQGMSYLEMVIKETLRLYPSVPVISRTFWDDVPIRNDKYVMPSTSMALFYIYHLHRNPEVFENPEKFDPDRFLPENSKNRNPYAYVPFSAGPRNCIGQKFAILEIKCIISAILRNFEVGPIDTPESIKLVTDLILRTSNGIHVKFKPRIK